MEGDPPGGSVVAVRSSCCSCDCLCCGGSTTKTTTTGSHAPRRVRVGPASEVYGLRETVRSLQGELEAERSASASAASEAMSMILRLQRERADALMDARQFRRLADERFAHNQQEIAQLHDLLFRKDLQIQSLSVQLRNQQQQSSFSGENLPDLRCAGKFDWGDEDLDAIQQRIGRVERSSSNCWSEEKNIITLHRRLSLESFGGPCSPLSLAHDPAFVESSDIGDDARVCTVDAVHGAPEDYVGTPRERCVKLKERGDEGDEIKMLYVRLQALEADRESMRQAIVAMSADKAQAVLLREIAQQLCKEPQMPERKIFYRRQSFFTRFSIIAAFKWVFSFFFWRKRSRIRHPFGLSDGKIGLLLLLEKSSLMWQKRFLSRAQRRLQ